MLQLVDQPGNIVFDNHHPSLGDSRAEILDGLCGPNKRINPKYFYDAYGSALFEQITTLPEYYPTRTERKILNRYADDITGCCGRGTVLIEPGSGSSEKVRLLLESMRPSTYVPLDISAEFLYEAAVKLAAEYPWLTVHAVCADFAEQWPVPDTLPDARRVAFYPGSTIGNLEPRAAINFLVALRGQLGEEGGVLIGVDLHKSENILHAAYNDADGITAAFNLNVLKRINALLDGDFEQHNFAHKAFYNEGKQRIEMHLVVQKEHRVNLAGNTIHFKQGETIHTENSYKYTVDGFATLAEKAGFYLKQSWLDEDALFSVHYLEAS